MKTYDLRNDYGQMARELIAITREVKATQTRFLNEKQLTWEQLWAFPLDKKQRLDQEYKVWLNGKVK